MNTNLSSDRLWAVFVNKYCLCVTDMGRGIQRILIIFVKERYFKMDMSDFSLLFLHLIYPSSPTIFFAL